MVGRGAGRSGDAHPGSPGLDRGVPSPHGPAGPAADDAGHLPATGGVLAAHPGAVVVRLADRFRLLRRVAAGRCARAVPVPAPATRRVGRSRRRHGPERSWSDPGPTDPGSAPGAPGGRHQPQRFRQRWPAAGVHPPVRGRRTRDRTGGHHLLGAGHHPGGGPSPHPRVADPGDHRGPGRQRRDAHRGVGAASAPARRHCGGDRCGGALRHRSRHHRRGPGRPAVRTVRSGLVRAGLRDDQPAAEPGLRTRTHGVRGAADAGAVWAVALAVALIGAAVGCLVVLRVETGGVPRR